MFTRSIVTYSKEGNIYVALSCFNAQMTEGGGNFQYPPKRNDGNNDPLCTSGISVVDPKVLYSLIFFFSSSLFFLSLFLNYFFTNHLSDRTSCRQWMCDMDGQATLWKPSSECRIQVLFLVPISFYLFFCMFLFIDFSFSSFFLFFFNVTLGVLQDLLRPTTPSHIRMARLFQEAPSPSISSCFCYENNRRMYYARYSVFSLLTPTSKSKSHSTVPLFPVRSPFPPPPSLHCLLSFSIPCFTTLHL